MFKCIIIILIYAFKYKYIKCHFICLCLKMKSSLLNSFHVRGFKPRHGISKAPPQPACPRSWRIWLRRGKKQVKESLTNSFQKRILILRPRLRVLQPCPGERSCPRRATGSFWVAVTQSPKMHFCRGRKITRSPPSAGASSRDK